MKDRKLRPILTPITVAAMLGVAACSGDTGKTGPAGTACTVTQDADTGTATITCDDGTTAEVSPGADGADGVDGAPCTVTDNDDGSKTISCDDGTEVTVADGADGATCTVTDNADGTKTISCDDGTEVTVADGADGLPGTSCTVTDNGDGTRTIECEDGSTITVADGENGEDGLGVEVPNFHGSEYLMSTGEFAEGKFFVDVEITAVTADEDGAVTVDFTVNDRASGAPVLNLATVSVNIAKLVPASADDDTDPDGDGESFNQWVGYIYREQTIAAGEWPNPAGTSAWQPTSQSSDVAQAIHGTLTNNDDGSYTYVLSGTLPYVYEGGPAITYDRGLTHRVAVMMGGHSGPTGNANFTFVPDGSDVTEARDIVETETCQQCHGWEFHGHGGNRLTTETCVTCHNPGNTDPNSGETVDFKVMIHKIHSGSSLPRIAGDDGVVFDDPATVLDESADNGEYAIWGNRDSKNEWWDVGFPAEIENCTKCHQGAGAQAENWRENPSRAACGSCHEDVDFVTGTNHGGGGGFTNDDDCTTCHRAAGEGGVAPSVTAAHDWIGEDPRMDPEFDIAVSMTPPANSTHYVAGEAPVVTVVLTNRATGLAIDHTTMIEDATGEGCALPGPCVAGDGAFRTANLFVHGPRARRVPVLTTAARAQILSSGTGPFNLSAANAALILKVDNGQSVHSTDVTDGDIVLPGTITVAVAGGTFVSTAAATTDEIVAWLNANVAFRDRAIAFNQAGRVGIRSRNLGWMHAIQLSASEVATQVFAGDLSAKEPQGSYASNNVSARTNPSNNDPKASRAVGSLTYALDPVDDLEPGTYILRVEFGDAGSVAGQPENFRNISSVNLPFQVGTATEEPAIARNCGTCHQGPSGVGLSMHTSRAIVDEAIDTCGNCHDAMPRYASNFDPATGQLRSASTLGGIGWTGAKHIGRRVHGIHNGADLNYPNATVDHAETVPGRNWRIELPQDVRNCEVCHTAETSGTWMTNPTRIACSGCHDSDAAMAHMQMMVLDPTPLDAWNGDQVESCATCHAVR